MGRFEEVGKHQMRVLLIDKNLVDPTNHKKWEYLAAKNGMELTAVTPTLWIENFRRLSLAHSFQSKFPIAPLQVLWAGKENRAFYLKGLGSEIRRFSPDVILCFEEPFSFFALQTLMLRHLYARSSKLVFYSWDNLAKGKHFGYRPPFLYAFIQRVSMKYASMLLTANEEGTRFFERAYPIPVRKLYFGVDIDSSEENAALIGLPRLNSFADSFLVGYVGRLVEMKGIDTIISAMALLDERVKLVILGGGPDRERLRLLTEELHLSERTIFLSSVSSSEARAVMRNLDVLVLPSRTTEHWKEQYGRVLIEAMALGIPVIGSSSGAIPEVVGECGFIFPENDAASLANFVRQLLCDEALRKKFSEKGLIRAREFSSERFADNLYGFLMELGN